MPDTPKTYQKTFSEIEHGGDEADANGILYEAGAQNIAVVERNYDAEFCVFSFTLPSNMEYADFADRFKKVYNKFYGID